MKIYLASNYSSHPQMRIVRDQLEELGHEVISRWINGSHEITDCSAILPYSFEMARFAEEDWTDLYKADRVIWFSVDASPRSRGGRHVEFGLALAWGIPVLVVGRKENVFHWLPQVKHFETLEEAIKAL